jgi:hypothetical protein
VKVVAREIDRCAPLLPPPSAVILRWKENLSGTIIGSAAFSHRLGQKRTLTTTHCIISSKVLLPNFP